MAAAREAAAAFVGEQPDQVRIGVVGIAAAAAVVQSPTTKREDILAALEPLEPQRGTALGSGLVISLDTALPTAQIDVDGFINPRRRSADGAEAAGARGRVAGTGREHRGRDRAAVRRPEQRRP